MTRTTIFLVLAAGGLLLSACSSGTEAPGPATPSTAGSSGAGGAAGNSSGNAGTATAGTAAAGSAGVAGQGTGGTAAAGSAGEAGVSGAGTGGAGGAGGTGGAAGGSAGGTGAFAWPEQKVAAVSLTYDDGLDGQLKYAVPQLDTAGLPGTFFLASFQGVDHVWSLPNTTDPLNARHEAWQAVLAAGHELASHTLYHPCDDNNPDWQPAAYDQMRMGEELDESIARLMRLGAPAPFTFAYPCSGDKRGIGPQGSSMSYAPLVAERFMAARVSDSGVADPLTVDLQQVPLFGTTDATGAELIAHVDEAIAAGGWTVFIFHGVGPEAPNCDINTYDLDACALNYLCTPEASHQELVQYLASKPEVWTATFKDVALHIQGGRGGVAANSSCSADPGLNAQCTDPNFPNWYRCTIPYTEPADCQLASIGNATDWYCCP